LAIDQYGPFQNARVAHVEQHLVALARGFADAGERRNPFVAFDHGMDQLRYEHGLANAGAAEHGCLAALRQWRQQVDDLDARRKISRRGGLR
jgi:hypothetical protein